MTDRPTPGAATLKQAALGLQIYLRRLRHRHAADHLQPTLPVIGLLLAVLLASMGGCTGAAATPATAALPVYEIVRPEQTEGDRFEWLDLYVDGQLAHRLRAQRPEDGIGMLTLELAYDELTDRARFLDRQPEPFEDITGDGLPNLVLLSGVSGGSAPGSRRYHLTVVTLRGHAVEFAPPIEATGEVLFFDDFNGDGRLEFVAGEFDDATLPAPGEIPPSDLIWQFDPQTRRYHRADFRDGFSP